jgi:predicted metal-dependent hydrolase
MSPLRPRSIEADGHRLEFHVQRSGRRTLEISVKPDMQVVVTAPMESTDARIATAVARRARWIRLQQEAFAELPLPAAPRQWVAGETHRYLGRQYRLRPVEGTSFSVRLSGAFFLVATPTPKSSDGIQIALECWYRNHAKVLLRERVFRALRSTTWLESLQPPVVSVRIMTRRWGSATRNNRVYFNLDLVKTPLGCVDYVVMHELIHLKVPHHGPTFWRLLSRCMPDWKYWRERLRRQEV